MIQQGFRELVRQLLHKFFPNSENIETCSDQLVALTANHEQFFGQANLLRDMFWLHSAVQLIIDPQTGQIVEANHAALQYYGYSLGQLRNMNISQINTLSPDEIAIQMQHAKQRNENHFNFKHRLADGSIRYVDVYSTPIILQNKSFLLSVIHDITERKLTEQKLEEAFIELQTLQSETSEQNENLTDRNFALEKAHKDLQDTQLKLMQTEKIMAMSKLTGSFVHEINNPLNFISAGVEALAYNLKDIIAFIGKYELINEENFSEKILEIKSLQKKFDFDSSLEVIEDLIEDIKEGSKRTLAIVRDLQYFADLQEDTIRTIDLARMLNAIVGGFTKSFEKNTIKVESQLEENTPPITCYPAQLNQAFVHIIQNSIDALPKGGLIEIAMNYLKQQKQLCVRIKDNGEGITRQNLGKIFEPFFTTKPDAKGLGLATVYGVIKKHEGNIEIDSQPNKGTNVIICLPINPSLT